MTQITIDNILLVEVPAVAFGFDVNNYGHESELMYMIDMEDIDETVKNQESLITKKLQKPGSWQFIGTTDEVTEAICEKIFDKPAEKTRYEIGGEDFITATAAWNYLRRVNRVPSDKRLAILKLNP